MRYLLLICALLGADQYVKYWITQHLTLGELIWPNPVFEITYVKNYGAAWSLFQNQRLFLIALTVAILVALFWFLRKNKRKLSTLYQWSLVLVISGAIGNLIDRLFNGYVVDMIELTFMRFPVFNLADTFLCIGIFGLIICILRED